MANVFRVVFLCFIASFFVIGLYYMLTDNGCENKNGCEMTYMWEYPKYIKVPLDKSLIEKFPNYDLYLYGEGKYAKQISTFQLTGIPVLFLPGNAGSFRQVRSLGSVALRMAESRQTPYHFNYFSIDFDEELVGLFGGILKYQTMFTHECVKKILSMYSAVANKPKSVILVGHSMGGVVARGLYLLPDFDPKMVTTIFTQATPHRPVIQLDSDMRAFYDNLNNYWVEHVNDTLSKTILISTGGGDRDILVRQALTTTRGLLPYDRTLSTSTVSIPKAWVSTDHLCHVWCKQFVMASVRMMFDMVDKTTKQLAVNPNWRMNAALHHFVVNTGATKIKRTFDKIIKLDPDIKWETRKKPSWRLSRNSLDKTRYSVIPLVPLLPDTEMAVMAMSNIDNDQWIGGCSINPKTKTCTELVNLSPRAQMVPPSGSERKVVHLGGDDLQTFSHLVIIIPKSNKKLEIAFEYYNQTERHFNFEVPNVLSFLFSKPESDPSSFSMINVTAPSAIFYNISLKGIDFVIDAHEAHLVVKECKEQHSGEFVGNLIRFYTPWALENQYKFLSYGESGNMSLKLFSSKPSNYPNNPQLHLYLHSGCSYQLMITKSWTQFAAQFVRISGSLLPTFILVQVLMTFSWQLRQLEEEGFAMSFSASHNRWGQPWRVVPVSMAVRFLLTYPEESSISEKFGLPSDDIGTLMAAGEYAAPLLPIALYFTAYALMELYAIFVECVFVIFGSIFGAIFGRCFMNGRILFWSTLLEHIILLSAIAVSATVCGTLGLVIVQFVYMLKCIAAYIWARNSDQKAEWIWSRFNVTLTLYLLFLLMLLLNFPSLIMWIKYIKTSYTLTWDASRWTSVLLCLCAFMLNFADFPTFITEWFGGVSILAYVASVFSIIFAIQSIYRAAYFVIFVLLMLAIPVFWLSIIYRGMDNKEVEELEKKDLQESVEETKKEK